MKKNYVRFFSVLLLVAMCLPFSVNAAEPDATVSQSGTIDLWNIENNPNVSVSERLTFPEMVERYANNEGISYQEALRAFPEEAADPSPKATYRRVFTITLSVNNGKYKPHLEIFCNTSEGGHFRNIDSIYSVQLVRSYNGISKQFKGEVKVWLREHNTIEYLVNGDFYNNGSTTSTITSGGTVGINKLFSLSFGASITSASNHYAYFYTHNTVTFSG